MELSRNQKNTLSGTTFLILGKDRGTNSRPTIISPDLDEKKFARRLATEQGTYDKNTQFGTTKLKTNEIQDSRPVGQVITVGPGSLRHRELTKK